MGSFKGLCNQTKHFPGTVKFREVLLTTLLNELLQGPGSPLHQPQPQTEPEGAGLRPPRPARATCTLPPATCHVSCHCQLLHVEAKYKPSRVPCPLNCRGQPSLDNLGSRCLVTLEHKK